MRVLGPQQRDGTPDRKLVVPCRRTEVVRSGSPRLLSASTGQAENLSDLPLELQKTTTVEAVYPMAYETFEGVVETFRASRQFDDYHLRGSCAESALA